MKGRRSTVRFVCLIAVMLMGAWAPFNLLAAGESPSAELQARNITASNSALAITPKEAARFLSQATFGADWETIHEVAATGPQNWIEAQFDMPLGYQQPYLEMIEASLIAQGMELRREHRRWAWWQQIMEGPDPLRQRVALALSEHFVVSDENGNVGSTPIGLANYYDMLLQHSFGNYRDLLMDVTRHPIMGVYLSHLRNRRSSRGRFPDENYAREIMQLFSIGLFELNPDGSFRLDGRGQPIPTYTNDDITEFAKIFTGLSFNSPNGSFSDGTPVWTEPMRMYDEFHEPGPKQLLRGQLVPAGQSGNQDLEDAIDNLFYHPNVGPFFGRRMIQRLVTSNPSPEYIERVTAVFNDNGNGVRGDLKAVFRQILLDPEARTLPDKADVGKGMLREAFLRRVHLARAFNASNMTFDYPISDSNADDVFGQRPLSSPTVFNFFLPDYAPLGDIADADLVAPEFQIVHALTAITGANELRRQIDQGMNGRRNGVRTVRLELSDEIAMAADVRGLVERLNLLLMEGEMSIPMKSILINALQQTPDLETRVEMAVHLISISPEYNVLQ